MHNPQIPDLSFPDADYGMHQTPWDLRRFLYKGGAAAKTREVSHLIAEGKLGDPVVARLPLVLKIHEKIRGDFAAGVSQRTTKQLLVSIRYFYRHADEASQELTLDNARQHFVEWVAHLHQQMRMRALAHTTTYSWAAVIAKLLAEVLELPSSRILLREARMKKPNARKEILGRQSDKQNLADTFSLGHALLDIVEALPAETVTGPLPVLIRFRTGEVLEEWSGLMAPNRIAEIEGGHNKPSRLRNLIRQQMIRRQDTSLQTRFPLVNLRLEAELLIFIAQTGMNLAQAFKLKVGHFTYQSHIDGYLVRRQYKNRRRGEVEFEIYSEYRTYFQRYLTWRKLIFPNDPEGLLFPFVAAPGKSVRQQVVFEAIKRRCAALGVSYIGPRTLRRTRINWLLRQLNDPDMTSEMAQHAKETLLGVYENPNHHIAMAEIANFHCKTDPAIALPGPGICINPQPIAFIDIPPSVPQPDCISPAGCLFCSHQRDIDSFDYVWSLASYRYLKSLEQSRYRTPSSLPAEHPVLLVIARINAKLKAFKTSSEIRAQWMLEALARVDEGDYHPKWFGFIELSELRS